MVKASRHPTEVMTAVACLSRWDQAAVQVRRQRTQATARRRAGVAGVVRARLQPDLRTLAGSKMVERARLRLLPLPLPLHLLLQLPAARPLLLRVPTDAAAAAKARRPPALETSESHIAPATLLYMEISMTLRSILRHAIAGASTFSFAGFRCRFFRKPQQLALSLSCVSVPSRPLTPSVSQLSLVRRLAAAARALCSAAAASLFVDLLNANKIATIYSIHFSLYRDDAYHQQIVFFSKGRTVSHHQARRASPPPLTIRTDSCSAASSCVNDGVEGYVRYLYLQQRQQQEISLAAIQTVGFGNDKLLEPELTTFNSNK